MTLTYAQTARHEVEYTEWNLAMMELRVQELEQRKRPLRDRLRGSDDELERAIGVLGGLRADKEKLRTGSTLGSPRSAPAFEFCEVRIT